MSADQGLAAFIAARLAEDEKAAQSTPRALLARRTLMWLAAIWSDHPDYQQEWKL